MTAIIRTPQIGIEIPLLALQEADVPERPAYAPADLEDMDVHALVGDVHPCLEQARQVYRDRDEVVHAYRCRAWGAWAVLHRHEQGWRCASSAGRCGTASSPPRMERGQCRQASAGKG